MLHKKDNVSPVGSTQNETQERSGASTFYFVSGLAVYGQSTAS